MAAIGETLRRERLRRNLDLHQVADELKLSTRFLEAIENEQFDRLPAPVFTRSWVRQYARLLGLDEEELAAQVARECEPSPESFPLDVKSQSANAGIPLPAAAAWDSISDGAKRKWPDWFPGLVLAVVVTVACSGVYVWWDRAAHAPPHAGPKAPDPQSVLAAPPAVQPAAASEPPAQPPSDSQPPATDLAAASPATPAQTAPQPAPAAQDLSPAAQPTAAAETAGPVHILLTARESVWVRARSNGALLFSITMQPSQTRTIDSQTPVELRLGNAGGVDVQLNGKSIGPVGPEGQIRTVQLTPGGFTIVAPSKPASSAPADAL
ncbi:MAG TPA: RodZ domain-containing protein [Bryobacteraceae bacterium]|nr:RodZ domain-containing protein [Bryobacteraceae bacterium]